MKHDGGENRSQCGVLRKKQGVTEAQAVKRPEVIQRKQKHSASVKGE